MEYKIETNMYHQIQQLTTHNLDKMEKPIHIKNEELKKKWIGKNVFNLSTPVMVVDIENLEDNLERMDSWFNGSSIKLRPHFKSHKCVELARRQNALPNTNGITCAKTSEAEVLVEGGLTDILIANQVIGADKALRIANMNKKALVRVAVDSILGIDQLSVAAKNANVEIGIMIEVNIGMNRGGVEPGEEVLSLAKYIIKTNGVRVDGLQAYEGHVVMLADFKERKQRVENDMKPLIETKKMLEKKGIPVFISSGGTGTYCITGKIGGIDELQCGSYALMDASYKRIRPEFLPARYVIATIITVRGDISVADVGVKGLGNEFGNPTILNYPDANVLYLAEEHMVVRNMDVSIGDKIKIIPSHGCTTNNLYSRMWISKQDIIEDIWNIEARGCLE